MDSHTYLANASNPTVYPVPLYLVGRTGQSSGLPYVPCLALQISLSIPPSAHRRTYRTIQWTPIRTLPGTSNLIVYPPRRTYRTVQWTPIRTLLTCTLQIPLSIPSLCVPCRTRTVQWTPIRTLLTLEIPLSIPSLCTL